MVTTTTTITNLDIYSWLHKKGFKIYPMELTMAERKIKYFSTVVRAGVDREDLASQMYWSDLPKKCDTWGHFEYEHVKNIKIALKYLQVSEQTANDGYMEERTWAKLLASQKKGVAYTHWRVQQQIRQDERHRLARNRQNRDESIVGDVYIRRRLP